MNEHELRNLMYSAQLPDHGSYVIRYPRGKGVLVDWRNPMEEIKTGIGRKLKDQHRYSRSYHRSYRKRCRSGYR